MRMLVTGGRGQLGRELEELSGVSKPPVDCWAPGHAQLDVTDPHALRRALQRFNPDVVVHAAAITDVDRCEREPELAWRVNAEATRVLALLCAERAIPVVYVSTDYVFDGRKGAPYVESDPTHPLSVYAATKLEGERAVADAGGPYAIVRTAWVYSTYGRNFPKTILEAARRASAGPEALRVVADQTGSPTYGRDLALAVLVMIKKDLTSSRRVFHAANAGACSRYEQARELLALSGWQVPVEPTTTAELNRPAPRPACSALDSSALGAEGIPMRPWREALADFTERLRHKEPDLFPTARA